MGVASENIRSNSVSLGPEYGTGMCSPHVGCSVPSQILAYPRLRYNLAYGSVEMLAHSWIRLRLPVMDGVEYQGGLDDFVADQQQAFREVREALKERQVAKIATGEDTMTTSVVSRLGDRPR